MGALITTYTLNSVNKSPLCCEFIASNIQGVPHRACQYSVSASADYQPFPRYELLNFSECCAILYDVSSYEPPLRYSHLWQTLLSRILYSLLVHRPGLRGHQFSCFLTAHMNVWSTSRNHGQENNSSCEAQSKAK